MAAEYWTQVLARRWAALVLILGLVVAASVALALRDYVERPFVSTAEVFVTATPLSVASTTPESGGYETEAQMIAQDLAAVLASRSVATDVSRYLGPHHYHLSAADLVRAISASSSGRTVTIQVSGGSASEADSVAAAELLAATRWRARYIGSTEASRSQVHIIGYPSATRVSSGHLLADLVLRVILGAVVAVAAALAWEYLDSSLRSPADLERLLGAPVLARISK